MRHYVDYVYTAIREYWNNVALTNYGKDSFTFGQVAAQMEKTHLMLELAGIAVGDRVVLCARNSAQWAMAYLGIVTFDGVAVPLLHEFLPDNVAQLTQHSDATALFTEETIWNKMDRSALSKLRLVVDVNTGKVLFCGEDGEALIQQVEDLFRVHYPEGLKPEHVDCTTGNLDELEIINYTSGTTSAPKGVMLSARNISSNMEFSFANMPCHAGWHMLSMLPLAHLYGLAFEFLFPFCSGCQIFFLGKTPTPSVLLKALGDVQPFMLITVPLVIEKIFKSKVMPKLEKQSMRLLLKIPGINAILLHKVKSTLLQTFGGHLSGGLILGGAAINEKVEDLLHRMRFPYTVGYGMTECAPLICYANFRTFASRSCGRAVDDMEIRIVNCENYADGVGEIEVKGDHVMQGYYKNPEATKNVFTPDGWMRTGDLGLFDRKGNLYIRGRSKNMILGANGQNIYPEEIEDKLNAMPLVVESIIVSRAKKLVALVVPDKDVLRKVVETGRPLESVLSEYLSRLNASLPHYSKVHKIELHDEPFEKTPKKSIKRFLYK